MNKSFDKIGISKSSYLDVSTFKSLIENKTLKISEKMDRLGEMLNYANTLNNSCILNNKNIDILQQHIDFTWWMYYCEYISFNDFLLYHDSDLAILKALLLIQDINHNHNNSNSKSNSNSNSDSNNKQVYISIIQWLIIRLYGEEHEYNHEYDETKNKLIKSKCQKILKSLIVCNHNDNKENTGMMMVIDLGTINNILIACSTIHDKQCVQQYQEFVLIELFRQGFCQVLNGSSFLATNIHILSNNNNNNNNNNSNVNDINLTNHQNNFHFRILFSLLDSIAVKKALTKLLVHDDMSIFDYNIWNKRIQQWKSSTSTSSDTTITSKRKRYNVNDDNKGQLLLELLLSYSSNNWDGVCLCLNIARENAIMALQTESVSLLQRCFCFAEIVSALTPTFLSVSTSTKTTPSKEELSFDHTTKCFVKSSIHNDNTDDDNSHHHNHHNCITRQTSSSSSSIAVINYWYSRRNPLFNAGVFRLWLNSIFFIKQQQIHECIYISARSFGFCLLVLLEVLRFHSITGLQCLMELMTTKTLATLDKNKVDTYLTACRHRLTGIDSNTNNTNSNNNTMSSSNLILNPLVSDITITRIRTWATTARTAGQLPAGVAQLCCMGGVSNVILAIQSVVDDIYHDHQNGFHINDMNNNNINNNMNDNDNDDKLTLVFTDCMHVLRYMLKEGYCGPINSSSMKQTELLLIRIQSRLEQYQGKQAETRDMKEELFQGGVSDLFQDLSLEINSNMMIVVNEACSSLEMMNSLISPLEVISKTESDIKKIIKKVYNETQYCIQRFQIVMRKSYSIMIDISDNDSDDDNSNYNVINVIRHRFASATILSCVRIVALVLDIIKGQENQQDEDEDDEDEYEEKIYNDYHDNNDDCIEEKAKESHVQTKRNIEICILDDDDDDDDDRNENFDYSNTTQNKKQQDTNKSNKKSQILDDCLKLISLLGSGLMLNIKFDSSTTASSLAWTDRVVCVKCVRHCIVSLVMHCIQDYSLRLTHLQPIFALLGACDVNTAQELSAAIFSLFVPTPQRSSCSSLSSSEIQQKILNVEHERSTQRDALIRIIPVTINIARSVSNINQNKHKNNNIMINKTTNNNNDTLHTTTCIYNQAKRVIEIMDSLLVLIT